MNLNVNEIFYALEGESTRAGFPAVFVRMTGCNLKCSYCDTLYAKESGKIISIEQVLNYISEVHTFDHITLTGGEPLMQANCIVLANELVNAGHSVQVETNGSIDLSLLPKRVRKIVDIKTPSSGEQGSFLWHNSPLLRDHDEIKLVISDMTDYNYAKELLSKRLHESKAIISFSPAAGNMDAGRLAELIITDQLPVRLNLQLHKVVWPDREECKTVLFQGG